jgi:hypothetical protein
MNGEVKELHFRNLPHSTIDWDKVEHINKINNWRNQIYGRAGMKCRTVTMWLPDEELWFELYYQLSIAESRARGILLPKMIDILASFNQTFAGRILQDHHGRDTDPRAERQCNAFMSKFNRMCPQLRARLQQCVFAMSGDAFVPSISLKMLEAYKRMKMEMEVKGVAKESGYSEDLEEWRYLFSHLPDEESVDIQDEPLATEEANAAAVLVSMALQPVRVQDTIRAEGEDPVQSSSTHCTEALVTSETPALSATARCQKRKGTNDTPASFFTS